jgi:23S rRNA pseudouridine1911/1915/1917 synthase
VIAKRSKSAQRLTQQLQTGTLVRTYLGWVIGELKTEATWRNLLQKNPTTNKVRVVKENGKQAILNVKPIKYLIWNSYTLSLVEFKLETGRSHQIRVQASFQGYPLLGDDKYSKIKTSFHRPALHSSYMEFDHPISNERLKFNDPLPDDLNFS